MAKKQPLSKRGPNDFAKRKLQPSQASKEWQEHEHVTPPLKSQAEELVKSAGSSELAKHAVDSVKPAAPPASDKDAFARQSGFTSYLDLFEASKAAGAAAGKNWFITALPGSGWIAWNDTDFEAKGPFDSADEAGASLPSAPQARKQSGTDGS